MSTEALACPNCRASDPTGPDAGGEYLCIYCGTRFYRTAPVSAPVPQPLDAHGGGGGGGGARPPGTQAKAGPVAFIVMGAVIMLMTSGVVAVLALSPADVDEPVAVAPARPAIEVTAVGDAMGTHKDSAPVTFTGPAAVAPAEAAAPATGSFEFHKLQSGYQTSFYALGTVTNTSPFVINKPKINAVLLDAEGSEVATDFGFAALDYLGPGDSSPAKILIKDPPEHASIRYEVVPRKASYIAKRPAGIRVEPTPAKQAEFGNDRWEVEGKVIHEGSEAAKFVEVVISAIDADGKLVGLGNCFADAEVLAPGASARFSTSFSVAEAPDHFEFVVSGMLAN